MQPVRAPERLLLAGEDSCSGKLVVTGESAIFMSDQQLLHQLFVINLFLLSLSASWLKIKGSELERQVYLRVFCLSCGFGQPGSGCAGSGQPLLPVLVLHPFV